MILIDGEKVSNEILNSLKDEVSKLKVKPHLVAILVGNNPASESYVGNKIKACDKVGFKSTVIRFPENISENKLINEIYKLNNDQGVTGFIVQLPLPKHISEHKIIESIDPSKDVDGFHPTNLGKMLLSLPCFMPATPYGILQLLDYYKIETSGKKCVVVGRSHIVGTPISVLMSRNSYPGNSTVILTHSKTENLKEITKSADILIVALGSPLFITSDMVKEGVVIIDVGINRIPSMVSKSGFRLCGDVDFDDVSPKCSYITPVPRGVGPMTIASLLKNTLQAYKNNPPKERKMLRTFIKKLKLNDTH